jgi:putative transposase
MQKYKTQKVLNKRKNIEEFIIDETLIKIGSKFAWLWIAIEDL